MKVAHWASALLIALTTLRTAASAPLPEQPRDARGLLVQRYLSDLQHGAYADAYALLNAEARTYYRDAENFRSVFDADRYRVEHFALVGKRVARSGSVYFARETARYRDYAHDADLVVTATVPIGVVAEGGGVRIKDPGHPRRAFAAQASATAVGLRVTVKKVSLFARRIETVVTFANLGSAAVTLLPYGKSILRDGAGDPYRIIETRDWSLTDRKLFEGIRLPPNAQYTGVLGFECARCDAVRQPLTLTLAPFLADGADTPFAIDVAGIGARDGAKPDPRPQ